MNKKVKALIFLALSISVVSCASKEEKSFLDKLDLKTLDGQPVTTNDLQGKMAFINVWATWCGPCLKEMPSIERAKTLLEDQDLIFIAISDEGAATVTQFINENEYTFDFALLGASIEAMNIYSLPTSFLVDSKGNLVYEHTGAKEWDSPENIAFFKSHLNK